VPGIPLGWVGGLLWDMPKEGLEAYASEHGTWGYRCKATDPRCGRSPTGR